MLNRLRQLFSICCRSSNSCRTCLINCCVGRLVRPGAETPTNTAGGVRSRAERPHPACRVFLPRPSPPSARQHPAAAGLAFPVCAADDDALVAELCHWLQWRRWARVECDCRRSSSLCSRCLRRLRHISSMEALCGARAPVSVFGLECVLWGVPPVVCLPSPVAGDRRGDLRSWSPAPSSSTDAAGNYCGRPLAMARVAKDPQSRRRGALSGPSRRAQSRPRLTHTEPRRARARAARAAHLERCAPQGNEVGTRSPVAAPRGRPFPPTLSCTTSAVRGARTRSTGGRVAHREDSWPAVALDSWRPQHDLTARHRRGLVGRV